MIRDTADALTQFQRVEVKLSTVDNPLAGEGLYTRIRICKGELVALYNGFRLPAVTLRSKDQDPGASFDYRIKLNSQEDVDVPENYRKLDEYRATLAHKSNHSFNPNCR